MEFIDVVFTIRLKFLLLSKVNIFIMFAKFKQPNSISIAVIQKWTFFFKSVCIITFSR
jgi:hypothetical protein